MQSGDSNLVTVAIQILLVAGVVTAAINGLKENPRLAPFFDAHPALAKWLAWSANMLATLGVCVSNAQGAPSAAVLAGCVVTGLVGGLTSQGLHRVTKKAPTVEASSATVETPSATVVVGKS